MAELVKVRGLNRGRGVSVNNKLLTSTRSTVVDLDDPTTRRDVQRHTTLGALIVVGDAPVAVATGAVVSNGTTTTWSVSAGTLLRNDGQTVTVGALNNQAITAADATNPRIDLVVVDNASGVVAKQDGTAAATPAIPVPAAGKTVLATLRVAANAATPAGVVITDVAPRL